MPYDSKKIKTVHCVQCQNLAFKLVLHHHPVIKVIGVQASYIHPLCHLLSFQKVGVEVSKMKREQAAV